MEIVTISISFILLLGLISAPIFLFIGSKKLFPLKFTFLAYLISGLLITAVIILIFAWWSYYSNIILLKHYGGFVFNPDSNDYQVTYENVLTENIHKVKRLDSR